MVKLRHRAGGLTKSEHGGWGKQGHSLSKTCCHHPLYFRIVNKWYPNPKLLMTGNETMCVTWAWKWVGGQRAQRREGDTVHLALYRWVQGEQGWTERQMDRKENMGNRNHRNCGRKASRVTPCLWAGLGLTRVLNFRCLRITGDPANVRQDPAGLEWAWLCTSLFLVIERDWHVTAEGEGAAG